MKKLVYFILITIFLSCKKKSNNPSEVNKAEDIASELKQVIEKNEEKNIFWNYNVDVQKVKSQLNGVTTGFLSKKETQVFLKRRDNKYYGFYTLLKNNNRGTPSVRVGKLIVYDSINPYKYEKNTDEFVEITLTKKGIALFDGKLQIGMSIEEIQKVFGKGDKEMDNGNILIYKEENKIAVLNFKKQILTRIKIGVYGVDVVLDEIIERNTRSL